MQADQVEAQILAAAWQLVALVGHNRAREALDRAKQAITDQQWRR